MGEKIIAAVIVTALVTGIGGYAIGNSMSEDSTETKTQMVAGDNSDGVTVGGAKMIRTLDIVDNAVKASNVSTTVDLVKKADLVETLKSEGPFTVFGPNNDAFAAVPEATLNKIAGDKELLTTVLTYHVVPGTYTSADLRVMASKGTKLKTVQGGMLEFKIVDGNVAIIDATGQQVMIETPDVISSNGVTHVIKNVLLPVDPSTL